MWVYEIWNYLYVLEGNYVSVDCRVVNDILLFSRTRVKTKQNDAQSQAIHSTDNKIRSTFLYMRDVITFSKGIGNLSLCCYFVIGVL